MKSTDLHYVKISNHNHLNQNTDAVKQLILSVIYWKKLRDYSKKKYADSKIMLGIIGVISGVLCGLFGIGALLAAYVGRITETSSGFKANLNAVFIVENTFRITLYLFIGVITYSSIKQALIMFPFMLIGLWLGIKCSYLLDEKYVKKVVIILLIISGVVLITKNMT